MLSSPEESFDSSADVAKDGLKELRRTADSLEEELKQLQTLVIYN